jgi:hypothetical protein
MFSSVIRNSPMPGRHAPTSTPGRLVRFAVMPAFGLIAGTCMPAFAYDSSWHRATGWSGEYPSGFTIAADMTIDIRTRLDPAAPKSVSCRLEKGATYHQWNSERVAADRLQFISFTRIKTFLMTGELTVQLQRNRDREVIDVNFRNGDTWSYLFYFGEGFFLMKFGDEVYVAGQELLETSTEVARGGSAAASDYDEWLGLRCANGAVGWILASEVKDKLGFLHANIPGYGDAIDGLPPP